MDWGSGIPGDGRCLFRSVVHGACLREGKSSPSESIQKELADELRAKVVDEFIKRRQDTEWLAFFNNLFLDSHSTSIWKCLCTCIPLFHGIGNLKKFLEGDFDAYVAQMRQPHIWGGEPELLMSSHVLQMPITVYMKDKFSGILKSIAEYGQEYGKDNPIRVLYNGCGHYDALQNPYESQAKMYNKR
ncbi:OVARIAN TUMOR DOMAIN-containing deubiquitinating enzyme 4-like isoform X2 [Telopea speciosissima]|uniref:OVARIAN TUMOR DOMAIN-containing deubiquitinating enzyme 4-like isoform X2 n=1 Tax=Telopea speciosissima TaxID=54955 RepID=UPI001CC70EFE|nr:OVARIAN TUMOR DOMAIN-containing deubiquitinating enzyme 4-like isoform X2 [Telopea speciosissima]